MGFAGGIRGRHVHLGVNGLPEVGVLGHHLLGQWSPILDSQSGLDRQVGFAGEVHQLDLRRRQLGRHLHRRIERRCVPSDQFLATRELFAESSHRRFEFAQFGLVLLRLGDRRVEGDLRLPDGAACDGLLRHRGRPRRGRLASRRRDCPHSVGKALQACRFGRQNAR